MQFNVTRPLFCGDEKRKWSAASYMRLVAIVDTLSGKAGRHPHTENLSGSIPSSSFVSLKAVSTREASPSSTIPPGKLTMRDKLTEYSTRTCNFRLTLLGFCAGSVYWSGE